MASQGQFKRRWGRAAFGFLFWGCLPLWAASITAVVKDPRGGAVAGANVTAEGKALPSPRQAVTDAQGRVRFDQLTAGTYHIAVTKDGFEAWERTVEAGDQPVELAVALKLKVVTTTVQVSGRRSPLANSDPNYKALRGGKLTKVYRVENLVLKRDVGTLTFRSGSFSFLPPVLGQVATGVFVGDGNFQLNPAFEIAAKHLHRMAGVDSVNEDFTAMVVYFSDATFDEVKQHSELADESPERHEEAFKRVKSVIERRREPPSPLMRGAAPMTMLERLLNYEDIPNYEAEVLAELYNPAQRGSFRAFLHGKKHPDLRFLVIPRGAMPMLAAPEETALINFDPTSESDGIWYLSHLASELQAGRASSSEDKRSIAPEHYEMQVFLGKENLGGNLPDLAVTCDLRFRSLEDGTRMLKFELVPDLQITRVAWEGKDIPFVQESRKQDGSFYLQMPQPLVKGHTYQVTLEYAGGEILQSLWGIPPRRAWYPRPYGPASRATYDMTFHHPRGMTVVSVGKKVKQARDGGMEVTEWSSDAPISQAVFRYIADYFGKGTTDEVTKMDLSAYVIADNGISSSAGDALIDAGNALHVFTAWFGPPAYESLAVVEGRGIGTDSFPGLIYAHPVLMAGYSSLVSQALVRSRGRGNTPPATIRTFLDEAFAGEAARQWFGNTVGSASFHDAWLSAGFANFAAAVYDLETEPDEFKEHWVRARDALLQPNRFGVRITDAGPVWMGLLNDTFKTPGAGNLLATFKGGYILHMLRCLMWDSKTRDADFRAMMQDYVKVFANRAVSTEEFQWMVEKHMKPEMDLMRNHRMDWFFREWVYGTEVPSYRLEYSMTREKGGKTTLNGKLTQSGVSNTFVMAVPVFGQFGAKKVRLGTLEMHGSSTAQFKVDVPEAPKHVLLNINHDVLTDHEEVKAEK